MSNFLNQLPALIGVLVGTLATVAATTVADRARWARSQSVRWDERRIEAFIEYARALKEVHALLLRMTADHRPGALSTPLDRAEALELLARAHARRTLAWESVLLLGDEATVAAARRWHGAIRDIELAARADPLDEDAFGPAVRGADEARDGFYAAVRRCLSVGGGDVAQVPWLDGRRGDPAR